MSRSIALVLATALCLASAVRCAADGSGALSPQAMRTPSAVERAALLKAGWSACMQYSSRTMRQIAIAMLVLLPAAACGSHRDSARVEASLTPFHAIAATPVGFPIYSFSDVAKPGTPKLNRRQLAELSRIKERTLPNFRRYLKFAFIGPGETFTIFLSTSAAPPDYGAESVALNDCHSTPHCTYACGTQIDFADNALKSLGPSGYACENLYFMRNGRR